MLNKLILSFVLMFILLTTLTYIAEGEGGVKVTRLSQSLSSDATVAYVDSTGGWPKTGTLEIGGESIQYSNTTDTSLLNLTRGTNDTHAQAHARRAKVYSEDATRLNDAMGFDLATINTNTGLLGLPFIVLKFFTNSVPDLIMWDFSILKEGPMQYFRMVLFGFSIAFLITLVLVIMSASGGVMQSIISRFGVR